MSDLASAFPTALRADSSAVALALPTARLSPASAFRVSVEGEAVSIPYRIYHAEPAAGLVHSLSPIQRTLLACLYTRHHNGHVRQRYLAQVAEQAQPWVVPFVVQLIGEYIVEIVTDIRRYLLDLDVPGSASRRVYGVFAAANPVFMYLTRQRATSYWDCYYRGLYAERKLYPAFDVLNSLRDAARSVKDPAAASYRRFGSDA